MLRWTWETQSAVARLLNLPTFSENIRENDAIDDDTITIVVIMTIMTVKTMKIKMSPVTMATLASLRIVSHLVFIAVFKVSGRFRNSC